VPLCVPSSLHSAHLQSLSLQLSSPSSFSSAPPSCARHSFTSRRRPNPVQKTASACELKPPEHAPVICAGAFPRESPSCATPPTPPPPRPAIALRLHVHVNVDLDLVAFARSFASRFDLPLPFSSLACVLVRSFPKERRTLQSFTSPRRNQLAAPTASQCAAIALTISQPTVEALPRHQLGQRGSKGKQTVLRGCWHTVQPGRLSTYGQTQFRSARAAGSRAGGR
jgi:hypothetical protein